MKRYLLFLSIILFLFFLLPEAQAQTQTVKNGDATKAINFPGSGCIYNWVNDKPGIGLAASGTGDIPSFTAINNGGSAVTATITATPVRTGFVYITNDISSGTVSVIDTATKAIAAVIPVGANPIGIALSPDGSRVYVTNNNSGTVSVISPATNTVIAAIPAGYSPYGIAVSPDGSRIYVTNNRSTYVSVIDVATNSVVGDITVGKSPTGIAIAPDGGKVYVANDFSNSVSVINAATNLVITTIAVDMNPYAVTVSLDGSRVYVVNQGSNSVSVINTVTDMVINEITVGATPFGMSQSPDGKWLHVTNPGTGIVGSQFPLGTVSIINTATGMVAATVGVGRGPVGVSFNPDGSRVYVANNMDNTVSVINTADNTVIATAAAGSLPSSFGSFVAGGTGCGATPTMFTIIVTPKLLPPAITAAAATGNIQACAGTASFSPNIQQFVVSGSGLTGNLTVTAPPGGDFEVSPYPGSGYGSSISLNQSAGNVSSTTVYVRSASMAAIGPITGNVTVISAGAASQVVAVTAMVNPAPTVDLVENQTFSGRETTKAINFTGTANTYTWTNDRPEIGLAAKGTGNIGRFTAINNGSSPVVATITVTPAPKPPVAFAYIANAGSNTVSVINTTTNQVVTAIPVGSQPEGISVSPDGSRVYVANGQSNSISVINTTTNSVIATITVGANPSGLVVSADGSKVYVCNDINVSVINAATNTIIATILIGEYPTGLAVSPDGSKLYVTNAYGDSNNANDDCNFYVVSTATNAVISVIEVGNVSNGVVVSPDGSRVYVANTFSNTISVINTATNAVIATIPTSTGPWGLCISPDGSRLYVTNSGDQSGPLAPGTVAVINTAANTVIATIPVDTYPIGISVSPDGSQVYVANDFGKSAIGAFSNGFGTVSVINTTSNTVKSTITVGYYSISFGDFISSDMGCSGAPVAFTITVNPAGPATAPIVIPNTFTPNGDGINDTWNIKNLEFHLNCIVDIFNRNGEKVYSSIGYGIPWDGTYKGAALPTGPYYYIIDIKNGAKPYSGSITIIR